jgi:hypothetical protein
MNPPTTCQPMPTDSHRDTNDGAAALVGRAHSLRAQAGRVDPVLAVAYRRRAAELSFEAWLHAIRSAPVDVDRFVGVAA